MQDSRSGPCLLLLLGASVSVSAQNLLDNADFERDEFNSRAERAYIEGGREAHCFQSDRMADSWTPRGPVQWLRGQARCGQRCLALEDKGSITQSLTAHAGTLMAERRGWRKTKSIAIRRPERVFGTVKFSVFARAENEGAKLRLQIQLGRLAGKRQDFAPSQEWTRFELALPAEEIVAAWKKKPETPNLLSFSASVSGEGPVFLDCTSATEETSGRTNLLEHGGFEQLDPEGYPAGWSRQRKYSVHPPQHYYIWTGWHHYVRENRGEVASDNLLSHRGARSLRMSVPPGDEKYVESDPVPLNQQEPALIEVSMFVRADRLRDFDIQAVNEEGDYLWGAPWTDYGGGPGAGTHDWQFVRKYFSNEKPIKSMRVRICARGMNGSTRDDAGERVTSLAVGTLWVDDVSVSEPEATAEELGGRGLKVPVSPAPGEPVLRMKGFDLGERLWGENAFTAELMNSDPEEPQKATVALQLRAPDGEWQERTEKVKVPAGGTATVEIPYVIDGRAVDEEGRSPVRFSGRGGLGKILRKGRSAPIAGEMPCRSWRDQCEARIRLLDASGKEVLAESHVQFGTWSQMIDVDFLRHVSYPDEPYQRIAMNLGIAAKTLAEIEQLKLEVRRKDETQSRITKVIESPVERIRTQYLIGPGGRGGAAKNRLKEGDEVKPDGPRPARVGQYSEVADGFFDCTNLIITELDLGPLPARPVRHPVFEWVVDITGIGRKGNEIFSHTSHAFAKMERWNETLPSVKTVEVNDHHEIVVNGRPFFIIGHSHQNWNFRTGASAEACREWGLTSPFRWGSVETAEAAWKANLYVGECFYFPRGKPPLTDDVAESIRTGKFPGVICMNTGGAEAGVGHRSDEALQKLAETNERVRKLTGRPISSTSGGDGTNWLPLRRMQMYDVLFLEWEPWGPRRIDVHVFPYHEGRKLATAHLPQIYEDNPYELVRFELYQSILEGARGFHGIHGFGDQTLLRALAGEVRGLEPYIFSHDSAPVTAEPDLYFRATRANGKIGIMATNCSPIIGGDWTWHTDNKASGRASHSGTSSYVPRRTAAGFNHHAFWGGKPVPVAEGDAITQDVFIPDAADVKAVFLLLEGNANWNHIAYWGEFSYADFALQFDGETDERNARFWLAAHLYNMAWGTNFTGDINRPQVFPESCFHRIGDLPKRSEWTRLSVSANELGLAGKLLGGCCYMEKGDPVLWDRTVLVQESGKTEHTLCEDSVGIEKSRFSAVRFNVADLKAGTRITVMFEGREIVAGDGHFEDAFQGLDGYGETCGGALGDYLTQYTPIDQFPTNPKSGYAYNNGPIACHAYELPTP